MDPRVAFVMTHLMREVINIGTGQKAKALGRPAAGKTGTTNDYKDAWFMGFTPELTTGVWVGFDDSASLGHAGTGAGAALPIWLGYMKKALEERAESDFIPPPASFFRRLIPLRVAWLILRRSRAPGPSLLSRVLNRADSRLDRNQTLSSLRANFLKRISNKADFYLSRGSSRFKWKYGLTPDGHFMPLF